MPELELMDRLDQAIDALSAGTALPAGDPELQPLIRIAAELRTLPDEKFQQRLKSDLQRRAKMPVSTAAPVQEGLHTVTPLLAVSNAPELIEFLKATFDAEETSRHPHSQGGFVASLRIRDSDVLVMSEESVPGRQRFGAFHVFVPDCDATYARAIAAGGTSMGEPADRPYGERSGFVKDSAGNSWYIATRLGDPVYIEGLRTVVPYLHPSKAHAFIDFAKRAFNAEQLAVYEQGGRVMHAAVRIGDTVLEMGEAEPQPCSFYLSVDDCDAWYQRAIAAGATSLWPPTDQPYGERTAGVLDPFGFQWMPATAIKNAR